MYFQASGISILSFPDWVFKKCVAVGSFSSGLFFILGKKFSDCPAGDGSVNGGLVSGTSEAIVFPAVCFSKFLKKLILVGVPCEKFSMFYSELKKEFRNRGLLDYFEVYQLLSMLRIDAVVFPEPNQSLEPTHTAVTNRACARFAPAVCVAHL
jgi:hypothetical protein